MPISQCSEFLKKTAFIALAAAFIAAPLKAPLAAEGTFSAAQKAEVQKMIETYVMENGDKIVEAVNAYREKAMQEEQAKATQNISKYMGFMTAADLPSAGTKSPDVTVVEFFDYNCGFCKRAIPDIRAVLQEDSSVRFVFIELPILGPSSLTAAQWALAAHEQGKYWEFHQALMQFKGQKDEATLAKIAGDLGLNVEKMKTDAKSEKITKAIEKNREVAGEIGVQGTPAFIIGKEVFRGYIGAEEMKSAIAVARSEDKKG